MYFLASKLIGFALTPSNLVGTLCVLGALLATTRFRRAGLAAAATGIALLALIGWTPAANLMLLPLTERFPAWQGQAAPDGIIVLGGAIDPEVSAARNSLQTGAAAERLFAMLHLARRYPNARIVYSGGSGAVLRNTVAEAPLAGRLLDEAGLNRGRVLLESQSRTTEENARHTRELVTPKAGERWLLVTSASHMPRAVGIYRKVGFDVEAYPVDFRLFGWADATRGFSRISYGFERADLAAHEWLGLIAARLNGNSDDWLPGPR